MRELDQAIEALTKLRINAVKRGDDKQEKSLYDIEQMIFKAYDKLPSNAPIGFDPSLKLTDIKRHYSQLINRGLKNSGISKSDLAKQCNAQSPQVTRWLSENHNFTIKTLFNIQSVLKINIIP